MQAIELIHNATLFHDDVIDEADIRRNKKALHKEFSNKIAILAGDYFLSVAIKHIYSLNNPQINQLFAKYMQAICEGEIEQNLSLNHANFKGIKNPYAKSVIGFKINGCDMKYYKYMSECENDCFNTSHVSSCCKNKRKSHKGYKWYYAEDYFKNGDDK